MSAARDRWLDEGIRVLAAEGASGVRIDRIAARLGLSKGSFHHHFDGAEGYKRDLLAYFERLSVEAFDRAIAGVETPGDARAVLGRLTELIRSRDTGLYRPQLEAAVRAWSMSDPDARAVQARIDQVRLSALQRVWRPHVATDAEARRAALLPYLLAVGATVMVPPVGAEELRNVVEMLLPLVPEEPITAAD
ncbi:TetR/AcrR family transcriptional regulator [Streptosporangium sp. NPDC006930]|uniref:TetR/AcrR family transcriptional regulator n=1 Tax=unclassified Streptosporangium TaxID=2632669 RepID=UPI00343D0EB5